MSSQSIILLQGYSITEQVHLSSRTAVYRGERIADQIPVAIKILRSEYPNFKELVLFRNQYTIAKNLNFPGIVKTYSLEDYQNGYALVMEDFGGISLLDYVKSNAGAPLSSSLEDFLEIAIQIVNILEVLYRNRIIHKDIKPANILISPVTKHVKLIDFSIASLLPKETQTLTSPDVLEGTLAYLSPEQTGRMNRGIDYRSDFYSFGVTLFELLTGELPFTSNDPMELIHCHIAKVPPTVNNINPAIPPILSQIVSKLMAKNAEDRYQSALGIKYDLEKCLHQLKETRSIDSFELSQQDISDSFIIPEKLYGREAEVATLLAAFDRVASNSFSQIELMLVAGFSGIGKTAVINEVHKPIVQARGYFIKGKFDQFKRDIPLSAFVQAFHDLIGQLLSETDAQIDLWKRKITQALGENAQVIIDVIPELEIIIGKQPPVTELSGIAAQNRFNLLFQRFIQVFTTKDHPLVIFLDDLQWADSTSLRLMQMLMVQASQQHLLIIGAYRDNEVLAGHPLIITLEESRKTSAKINTITLAPLKTSDINSLIGDALNCPPSAAEKLTKLVYEKTKGNPFFVNQFLKSLFDDGLILFNFNTGYWECDLTQIRSQSVSTDVVDFMASQLTKLPSSTQNVLKLAACIGNQFDLSTLAVVNQKSEVETAAELWNALRSGYILPQNEIYKFYQNKTDNENLNTWSEQKIFNASDRNFVITYKFLHDRVQQAAYSLIPEKEKQLTHLKIGRSLRKNLPESENNEIIFEIVNHLNKSITPIALQAERDELAYFNLLAGRKARSSTAYGSAISYFTAGISVLATHSWQTNYELTLHLHEDAAEAAYLSGNFEQVEEFIQVVFEQAKSPLDQIKIHDAKIQAFGAQAKPKDAVLTALSFLKLLDIDLPENPNQSDVQIAISKTKSYFADRDIEDLINLPQMSQESAKAAMRIISSVITLAYQAAPNLFLLMIFKQIELTIKYGNTSLTAFVYVIYGFILSGLYEDIENGYKFGKLGVELLGKLSVKDVIAKVILTYNSNVRHWKEHIKETLKPLQQSYTAALDAGDLEFAALSAHFYCYALYYSGQHLVSLQEEMLTYCIALKQIKQDRVLFYNEIYRQTVLNLLGLALNPCRLIGEAYNEEEMLQVHRQSQDGIALLNAYFCKLQLCYLFGEYSEALENASKAKEHLHGGIGNIVFLQFHFYSSLAQLAVYPDVEANMQQQILEEVATYQEKMLSWAHHAPMNYQHKYYLVEAERYRALGERLKAMELYDCSVAIAKENGYIQEEALANELAAKFYLQWDKEKIAKPYLIDAYYCYARWGAKAKVKDLEQKFPNLLTPILAKESNLINYKETISWTSATTVHSSTTTATSVLDVLSVVKAYQAISEEIEIEKLLKSLMQVVLENAGASKAVLILKVEGKLVTQATISSDDTEVKILESIPLSESIDLPVSFINHVSRTEKLSVVDDITSPTNVSHLPFLHNDSYLLRFQPKSLMGIPVINQGKLIGILYLENRLTSAAFSANRVELLNLICAQAGISLENARLYQQAQNYGKKLEFSLEELKQMQLQLVQSEKMSALGNLVSGVAHEINNPIGFIAGNLKPALEYVQDLFKLIDLYQHHNPNPAKEISTTIKKIELDYIRSDLPQLISSMNEGVDRIFNICKSLRSFSRADRDQKVLFNIHEGLDSTLLILKHRLKANSDHPTIRVIREYGELPEIKCLPGQLNQVFMNLLANAIDALDESNIGRGYAEIEANPNQIFVRTAFMQEQQQVAICIGDNGVGMSDEVKQKIFDYLYTTKAVGKGTGLGLAIARQIVVEKHGGSIEVSSTLGVGTEFIITIPV